MCVQENIYVYVQKGVYIISVRLYVCLCVCEGSVALLLGTVAPESSGS